MVTLSGLKQKIDEGYAAQRPLVVSGSVVTSLLYREDGYYVVTDTTKCHKECWIEWQDQWTLSEDWVLVVREMAVDDLLTVKQVAQRLGIDQSTVRRWIKDGRLQAITFPCHMHWQPHRVRRSTIDQLLQGSGRL